VRFVVFIMFDCGSATIAAVLTFGSVGQRWLLQKTYALSDNSMLYVLSVRYMAEKKHAVLYIDNSIPRVVLVSIGT
jgi:hypothetical protein